MFDLGFEAAEADVVGAMYDKDAIVNFTIVKTNQSPQYKTITIGCVDENGGKYDFKFGGDKMSPNKKKMFVAFLSTFFTREQLISKTANPVELMGQRFEAKSEGQFDFEGKKYQQWAKTFRKIVSAATAEEFMV
jgi:hypothetical protein